MTLTHAKPQINQDSLRPAHTARRLVNAIIDSIVWIIIYLSAAYVIDAYLIQFNSRLNNYIYSSALALITYMGYYCLFEFYFNKTLGKLVTQTKVISELSTSLTFLTLVKRNASRLIPIDPFFYLFSRRGLHDRLSKTLVVRSS